ncbi:MULTISPECIES: 5-formyltetrahydrofolate cyclo-ligase [Candidatus Ichthyocystis]|uniref:5-formyltetrahydrofolate cyclo-ligase n=1 Tax=Candidatus Ichthyocystis TaxID=2929841 RepID=UPI000B84A61F|nr:MULTISPECIES: 5-formyltetrahydrofolate cyclo-ligase [Ichthyocystis]
MSVLKKDLRKGLRNIRESMTIDYKSWSDRVIQKKLLELISNIKSSWIGFYFPIHGEPDLLPMASFLQNEGARICFPRANDDDSLSFYQWRRGDLFDKGRYLIPELMNGSPEAKIDTIVIPMLGWTLTGYRVGYGKGCFDRFLSEYPEVFSIGVSYSNLIVNQAFEEEHDLPVHKVITEREIITC